ANLGPNPHVESEVRIDIHIGDVNSTAFEQGASGDTAALWRDGHISPAFHEFGGEPVGFGAVEHAIDLPSNGSLVGVAQACRRFNQRLQHRLEVKGRAADDLEHVGGGGLLLQRFAQLVEQARVLDGDDGLGGKILHQLDLLVGEGQYLLAVDADRADQV